MHSFIDYAFAANLLIMPSVLHVNKNTFRMDALRGATTLAYSEVTDYISRGNTDLFGNSS